MRAAERRPAHLRFLLVAGAALVAAIALVGDGYRLPVLTVALIYGVVLVSTDVLVGSARQVSLGMPAFMAVGAYTTALASTRYGWPDWLGLVVAIVVCTVAAYVIGRLLLRVAGLGLVLVTLFLTAIVSSLIAHSEWLGGSFGISSIPALSLFGLDLGDRVAAAVVVGAVLLATLLYFRVFVRSSAGVEVRAVGTDETVAAALGIDVPMRRVQIFTLNAVTAAVAGFLYARITGFVSPENFGVLFGTDLLLMLFLGGLGSLWGPTLGAVVIVFVPELGDSVGDYRLLIEGALFILVLVFLPKGLAGALGAAARRVTSRLPWGRPVEEPVVAPSDPEGALRRAPTPSTATARPSNVVLPDVPATPVTLTISNITKEFGGVRALDNVSLGFSGCGVTGLLGPNGAGKSTLFNVIAGALRPDAGHVVLDGEDITGTSASAIARMGVARTFQTVRLVDGLDVRDNVALGTGHTNTEARLLGLRRTQWDRARAEADDVLVQLGLGALRDRAVGGLPLAERRLVELARALARRPRLLLLDEPASGLDRAQRDQVADVLCGIGERTAIALVEHDVRFVTRVASRMVVLAEGRTIFDGTTEEGVGDRRVIEVYLGQSTDAPQPLGQGGGST